MLTSFVITLIECLEIAFITLLISQTKVNKSTITIYASLGLLGGLLSAYFLHDILENCSEEVNLCIASNLSTNNQEIKRT